MKRLLLILFVFVVIVAVAGLYQGWFTVTNPGSGNQGSKTNINLEIDRDRMREDAKVLSTKAKELKENVMGSNPRTDDN